MFSSVYSGFNRHKFVCNPVFLPFCKCFILNVIFFHQDVFDSTCSFCFAWEENKQFYFFPLGALWALCQNRIELGFDLNRPEMPSFLVCFCFCFFIKSCLNVCLFCLPSWHLHGCTTLSGSLSDWCWLLNLMATPVDGLSDILVSFIWPSISNVLI